MMLSDEELVREVIRVRFALVRINGVLASEGRPIDGLVSAEYLVDWVIRELAPEVE